jgi:hypothetical protein
MENKCEQKEFARNSHQISIITIAQKRKQMLLLSLFIFYQNLTSCDYKNPAIAERKKRKMRRVRNSHLVANPARDSQRC